MNGNRSTKLWNEWNSMNRMRDLVRILSVGTIHYSPFTKDLAVKFSTVCCVPFHLVWFYFSSVKFSSVQFTVSFHQLALCYWYVKNKHYFPISSKICRTSVCLLGLICESLGSSMQFHGKPQNTNQAPQFTQRINNCHLAGLS